MDERYVLPREHLPNDCKSMVTVVGEDAVCDAALVVIGAYYLLMVDQFTAFRMR